MKDSEEPKPDAANVLAWDLTLLSTGRSGNPIPWSGKGRPSKTDKATLADEQNLRDSLLAFMVAIVSRSVPCLPAGSFKSMRVKTPPRTLRSHGSQC